MIFSHVFVMCTAVSACAIYRALSSFPFNSFQFHFISIHFNSIHFISALRKFLLKIIKNGRYLSLILVIFRYLSLVLILRLFTKINEK